MLVVQLREEAVTPPSFHGVSSVGSPDQGAIIWQKVGKDCGWEHPRAPALRRLWKDDAVGAVVELLENTRVGSRASAEMARARVGEDRDGDETPGQESEEDGPGPSSSLSCPETSSPSLSSFLLALAIAADARRPTLVSSRNSTTAPTASSFHNHLSAGLGVPTRNPLLSFATTP